MFRGLGGRYIRGYVGIVVGSWGFHMKEFMRRCGETPTERLR